MNLVGERECMLGGPRPPPGGASRGWMAPSRLSAHVSEGPKPGQEGIGPHGKARSATVAEEGAFRRAVS